MCRQLTARRVPGGLWLRLDALAGVGWGPGVQRLVQIGWVAPCPLQDNTTQPVATDQLQHQRCSDKKAVPAWVQRARQAAVDVTPALLAAAVKCPPVEPLKQASPGRPSTQGWLAYRVAAQLPQATACRSADSVLELGAAAAAAAAPTAHGAPLSPAAAGLAAAGSRGAGSTGAAGMDLAEAAGRLLSAARPSQLAAEPRARLARFFASGLAAARCGGQEA